jgi:hypothetical protein
MPDVASRMLVIAMASALRDIEACADAILMIHDHRNDPSAVRLLVLEALVRLEQMQMSLTLEPPFPEELSSPGS